MYTYEANVTWEKDKQGRIHVAGKPDIQVATPAEFGGPPGIWSPEEIFTASVASCLMSTFLYFVKLLGIALHSYTSTARGVMEKTPDGLRFTGMDVEITAEVDEAGMEKASGLGEKLERYCPISTSLDFPVRMDLRVLAAGRSPA